MACKASPLYLVSVSVWPSLCILEPTPTLLPDLWDSVQELPLQHMPCPLLCCLSGKYPLTFQYAARMLISVGLFLNTPSSLHPKLPAAHWVFHQWDFWYSFFWGCIFAFITVFPTGLSVPWEQELYLSYPCITPQTQSNRLINDYWTFIINIIAIIVIIIIVLTSPLWTSVSFFLQQKKTVQSVSSLSKLLFRLAIHSTRTEQENSWTNYSLIRGVRSAVLLNLVERGLDLAPGTDDSQV